jgi:hypothetical protein
MHHCVGLVRILSQYRIPLQSNFLAYFRFLRIKGLQYNRVLSLRICMPGGVSLLAFELIDFREIWYGSYVTEIHPNLVDFNFIQQVIRT